MRLYRVFRFYRAIPGMRVTWAINHGVAAPVWLPCERIEDE
jgi:hypothetical protein